jgi:hypothetical protein
MMGFGLTNGSTISEGVECEIIVSVDRRRRGGEGEKEDREGAQHSYD